MKQPETLFDIPKAPKAERRPPRHLMHVYDAGDCGDCCEDEVDVIFRCRLCKHETEWTRMRTVTEAKRGIPCPKCNTKAES